MEALFYRAERKNKYMKLNMENKKRIVVKVGTSTLTYPSGLMNLRKTERLVRCIADMQNSGRECLLVSSGAVSCGLAKIGLVGKPLPTEEKQAAAAVGQCGLRCICTTGCSLRIRARMIAQSSADDRGRPRLAGAAAPTSHGHAEDAADGDRAPSRSSTRTTALPSEELRSSADNDTLSAVGRAAVPTPTCWSILTDMDGLFDDDPRACPDARLIPVVARRSPTTLVRRYAGGAGSARTARAGCATKLEAAASCVWRPEHPDV